MKKRAPERESCVWGGGYTKSGNSKDYHVKGKINIYTYIEEGGMDMKQRYRGRFSALISRNYKGIIEKQIRKKKKKH